VTSGSPNPPAHDAPARRALHCPLPKWGRRLGAAAFLFFLIKGLLWLIIPGLVVMGVISTGG
jgi:hypothetical protein